MEATLAVIGLFVLRLGAPIAMMAFLIWALRRYARQEEARELEQAQQAEHSIGTVGETVKPTS